MRIVIDPGHGGKDPGAVKDLYKGKLVKEKDITLAAAHLLYVSSLPYYYDILLTRTGDETVSLSDRVNKAIDFNANLFISLHCNASEDETANGVEVWVYENSKAFDLAKTVCELISRRVDLKNRGVKTTSKLYVLKKTPMPAILVEMGFITSRFDVWRLIDPISLGFIVTGIHQAIAATLGGDRDGLD